MREEVCDVVVIHQERVDAAKKKMISDGFLLKLSETFKVLGDVTRVKILYALSGQELCVCDISAVLGMSQSAVSHQLRRLKDMKLVKYRKQGKVVYYSLDDEHIVKIFNQGLDHVKHA